MVVFNHICLLNFSSCLLFMASQMLRLYPFFDKINMLSYHGSVHMYCLASYAPLKSHVNVMPLLMLVKLHFSWHLIRKWIHKYLIMKPSLVDLFCIIIIYLIRTNSIRITLFNLEEL